jgi:1,4-alpha-glucan branching enzyme
MPIQGAFTFVLHSHLPYARQAGRWPHGEEWLHEAAAETYIPLLNALNRLLDEGIPARLTLTLTPILLEQLADEDVQNNFRIYLQDRIEAAERDILRFQESGDHQALKLAEFYSRWYQSGLQAFDDRYDGNLVPAFRQLQQAGMIEIATCAATHGYLPLLGRDESIELQLRTAVESYKRHFGSAPRSIWLPECAYRPGFIDADGRARVGIEDFLAKHGLGLFFAETHMVEGGSPVGMAAGEAIGPYGAVIRRYLVPLTDNPSEHAATTFQPYFVGDADVAVLARNNTTGLQVWSAEWGYPGEFDYREFHKKDGTSGMQYWRVTGPKVGLGAKERYDPETASRKVQQHADHFAELVEREINAYHDESGTFGIIAANFDTELFGHWWFEGVDWLEGVLRRLASSEIVQLTTASTFIKEHPPQRSLNLPEGSWGAGGTHFVWDNVDTHWIWPIVYEAEARMAEAISQNPAAKGATRYCLDQAARELLLLQSSDWPFLVTTGQAREYAVQRFLQHVERFNTLVDQAGKTTPDISMVEALWERDKIFPEIDYRWFKA